MSTPHDPLLRREAQALAARLQRKVPAWHDAADLVLPTRLALEQCSGGAAAAYKAEVVRRLTCGRGGSMADLTGGLGVDFVHLAPVFARATYVEQRDELVRAAHHNLPRLLPAEADGGPCVTIVHGDGTAWIEAQNDVLDLLFLDPARRDGTGRKTVALADCTPDVERLMPMLRRHARHVMVKLSPMLDISAAVRALPAVTEVHVAGDGNECKELLLVIRGMADGDGNDSADNNADDSAADIPMLYVADGGQRLTLPHDAEAQSVATTAARPATYLYEPSAAVLKAGLFRWVSAHYGLDKLHPLTHLYTADRLVAPFPGRTFAIEGVHGFGKREVRQLVAAMPQANLAVRHFPTPAETLRRRFHLRDGGDHYWFATTLADGSHALIVCRKVDHAATALDESPQRP